MFSRQNISCLELLIVLFVSLLVGVLLLKSVIVLRHHFPEGYARQSQVDSSLKEGIVVDKQRTQSYSYISTVYIGNAPVIIPLYLSSYSSWPTDYNDNKPSIMYQKISSDQIRVVIKADFEAFGGTSFESFSRELFAFLDFNPYMRYFQVIKESTYSIFSVYDKSETLRYLDFGLYATEEDLKESKFERKLSDDIYTLDELDDLIENGSITDYDGSGDLLRLNGDNSWTKSNLRMSVDSKVPKYARDHFTHFIWYNR